MRHMLLDGGDNDGPLIGGGANDGRSSACGIHQRRRTLDRRHRHEDIMEAMPTQQIFMGAMPTQQWFPAYALYEEAANRECSLRGGGEPHMLNLWRRRPMMRCDDAL